MDVHIARQGGTGGPASSAAVSGTVVEFISSPHLHAKRLKRGIILTVLGLASAASGFWILGQNIRAGESSIATNWLNYGPIVIAAALLAFGIVGIATGRQGTSRSAGDDSIDVIVTEQGLVTRGGREVPWSNIGRAEVIRYINDSMVPLLWDYSVLNRVVRISLLDNSEIDPNSPGVRGRAPMHYLEIDLRRYPMAEYQEHLDALVATLKERRFHTKERFKHKQF